MKFIAPIGDEILPDKENGYLCACEWINHKLKGVVDNFPYERNSRSLAYIPYGEGSHYFMSGAFGGRTKEYIEMCSEIEDNIRRDFQDGIIAIWHDESHFNKYMLNKNPLIMPSGYIIPENWKIKSCKNNRRGLLLNKKHWKYGGQSYLRGISDKKITPFKYWVSKLFNVKV